VSDLPPPSKDYVVATGYLVIEGQTNGSRVMGAKFKRTTAKPPYTQGTEVAIKLSIRLPKSVFAVALANIDVEVPEELVSQPDVRVMVEDAVKKAVGT